MKVYKTSRKKIVSKINGYAYTIGKHFDNHLAKHNMSFNEHTNLDYAFTIINPKYNTNNKVNITLKLYCAFWEYQEISDFCKEYGLTIYAKHTRCHDGKFFPMEFFIDEKPLRKLESNLTLRKKNYNYVVPKDSWNEVYNWLENNIKLYGYIDTDIPGKIFDVWPWYNSNKKTIFIRDSVEAALFALRFGDIIMNS